MPKRNRSRQQKATFLRLRAIREEQLGWEVTDIVSRLPHGKPSGPTIYRLEQGHAIRLASARRVFDVVNAALGNTLDAGKELEVK